MSCKDVRCNKDVCACGGTCTCSKLPRVHKTRAGCNKCGWRICLFCQAEGVFLNKCPAINPTGGFNHGL